MSGTGGSSSSSKSVRSVGDGSTAVLAFREALNKPDFADVIFEVTRTAGGGGGNDLIVNASAGSGSKPSSPTSSAKNKKSAAASTNADGGSTAASSAPQTIHAHRAILAARSPVFREMFFGGYPESRQKNVVVEDFRFDHFMTVLEWAYCGTAHMSAKDVLGVLQCANYYGLDDLMAECRDLAQSFIDEENVLHLLEHASSLGETPLVVQCLNFIKAHAHAVLASPVWLTVSAECVERVLSLPAIDCEEALLFEHCMAWLEANTTLQKDLVDATRRKAAATAASAAGKKKKTSPTSPSAGTAGAAEQKKKQQQQTKSGGDDAAADALEGAKGAGALPQNEEADEEAGAAAAAAAGNGDTQQQQQQNDADDGDEDGVTDDDDDDDEDDDHTDSAAVGASERPTTGQLLPSAPFVRRFFRLLRLSHLSVTHLLDRIRPLLVAHPSVRSAYVAALEYLVAPGHVGGVTQVPRAPTVLGTVQVDVSTDFLRGGWKLLLAVPQSASTGMGFNQTQLLPPNFFADVPAHAAYICVGEMVVGRDDAISVMAVGCVRIVRPMIGSRAPMVQEDGEICWHASPTSFGFSPRDGSSAAAASSASGAASAHHWRGTSAAARYASATPTARAHAGVRFGVATPQQQQMGTMQQEDGPNRHGKRFIYYK